MKTAFITGITGQDGVYLTKFLLEKGYNMRRCVSEEMAREECSKIGQTMKWPVHVFTSDTSGEKAYEEFYMESEEPSATEFSDLSVINYSHGMQHQSVEIFLQKLDQIEWHEIELTEITDIFSEMIPQFKHIVKNKNLNSRM